MGYSYKKLSVYIIVLIVLLLFAAFVLLFYFIQGLVFITKSLYNTKQFVFLILVKNLLILIYSAIIGLFKIYGYKLFIYLKKKIIRTAILRF